MRLGLLCVTVNEITKAAATLGRLGGLARSEKKAAAVRENGKKGGRPRKKKSLKQPSGQK